MNISRRILLKGALIAPLVALLGRFIPKKAVAAPIEVGSRPPDGLYQANWKTMPSSIVIPGPEEERQALLNAMVRRFEDSKKLGDYYCAHWVKRLEVVTKC